MEDNWRNGRQTLTRIECHSENSKGVYCLQYDDKHIVSGLRDNTIKVCHHVSLDIMREGEKEREREREREREGGREGEEGERERGRERLQRI